MAQTPWWFCPKCGFKNAPHAFRPDNTKCEQCGSPQAAELAVDYRPGGV